MNHTQAVEALDMLLAELPAEFSMVDPDVESIVGRRSQFSVIKRRNVETVHRALWTLQEYLKGGTQ